MEKWLTVKEVAPIIQMPEQALYAAIRGNQFPAIRIGRRIRISPQTLRDLALGNSTNRVDSIQNGGDENG